MDTGLSNRELADRLGWSTAKVSRIESGYRNITEIDVVRYAAFCGLDRDHLDDLLNLCRAASGPGFWLSNRIKSLVFQESTASVIHDYCPLVVPGLLQTEGYAAALMNAEQQSAELARQGVCTRMERQRVLSRQGAVKFQFFIHEQALRLPVGGARVMNEQLLKLVLLSSQPYVSVRVLPIALGERSLFAGPFIMLDYLQHPPLVYLEHSGGNLFLEDHDYVLRFRSKLGDIAKVALDEGQSRVLLANLASEYDRTEGPADVRDPLEEEQSQRRRG